VGFLDTSLLILILACGILAITKVRKSRREIKQLREAIKRNGRVLQEVHRNLARIAARQEKLHARIGAMRTRLDGTAAPMIPCGAPAEKSSPTPPHEDAAPSEAPARAAELPRFSRERIARECAILQNGMRDNPQGFLNLVHGIPKAGNSSLLATLWNSPEIIGGAMSSHFLSEPAMRALAARAGSSLDSIARFEHARNRRTRKWLGELGFLNDWPRPDGSPPPPAPLRVVCPFREPVASMLSLRAYRNSIGEQRQPKLDSEPYAEGLNVDHPEGFGGWMEAWVENELKRLYGFDFLAHPFDTDRGFTCYDLGHVRLLVITLEAMKRLPDALSELYGCAPSAVRPLKTNDSESREDAAEYRRRVDAFRLPAAMADRIYSAPLPRHLYSERQLETFRARWTAGRS